MLNETTIQETIDGNMLRNVKLLAVLRDKGVVLNVCRKIDFHYWARNESDAERLRESLIQSGAAVKEVVSVKGDNENLWSLTAEVNTTPVLAGSQEQTRTNTMLAAGFDCIYDGWGMRV